MCTIENISGSMLYAEDVYKIDRECFGNNCWSLEIFKNELAVGDNIYMICNCQKEIAGFLAVSFVLDEAELNRIALKKDFRNRGLATRMLSSLVEILKQQNFKKLMLEVRSSNISAIQLYKKMGFKTDCIRKEYYHDPSDDAILMSLNL